MVDYVLRGVMIPVCHHGYEAINVSSQVNLDEVTISQDRVRLTEKRRVVADDVVDGDACGEGHSCN